MSDLDHGLGEEEEEDGNVKRHICSRCKRRFKRSEHLRRHLRTHTQEKPFGCAYCMKVFGRQDLLKRHQRLTHGTSTIHERVTQQPSYDRSLDPTRNREFSEAAIVNSTIPTADEDLETVVVQHNDSTERAIEEESSASGTLDKAASQNDGDGGSIPALSPMGFQGSQNVLSERTQAAISQEFDLGPANSPQQGFLDSDFENFYTKYNPIQNFGQFIDSMGLVTDWPTIGQPVHGEGRDISGNAVTPDLTLSLTRQPTNPSQVQIYSGLEAGARETSPFEDCLPSVPFNSRQFQVTSDFGHPRLARGSSLQIKVTESHRESITSSIKSFSSVLPVFRLPSRHTLTRYLNSYVEGFHKHMPFMHIPTFRIEKFTPELVLAFAAIGAQYRFEHQNSISLFFAAKAIVLERLKRCGHGSLYTPSFASPSNGNSSSYHSPQQNRIIQEDVTNSSSDEKMDSLRCMLVLIALATWERSPDMLQEAFELQGRAVSCLREAGLREVARFQPPLDWHEWAQDECDRRTKLMIFCFLDLQCIAYNLPPALLSSEVHLRLPSTCPEWGAPDPQTWMSLHQDTLTQRPFQDVVSMFIHEPNSAAHLQPSPSPLGSYVILHAIIQRTYLVRQLSLLSPQNMVSIPSDELDRLERGLHNWTTVWYGASESSLDPTNQNGPIPFTSTALLGLAYIRLHLDIGPHRLLASRDSAQIAAAICNSPVPQRNVRLTPALLFSAHALSIVVNLGIDYVSHSQAFFWSTQHSICSFECAIILSRWLWRIAAATPKTPLDENESYILEWVKRIVVEAQSSMDQAELTIPPRSNSSGPYELAVAVVKIWSRVFLGNTQWPIVNIIGRSLEIYSDVMAADLPSDNLSP